MAKIIYLTGGQRSGKSSAAQRLALSESNKPIYIATAVVTDNEMDKRIERHKRDRGNQWKNIEEPLYVGDLDIQKHAVVVLDCITLWLSSIFFKNKEDVEKSFLFFKNQWAKLISKDIRLIVVSNEIGMGLHADTEMGRKFTDLQGWTNQLIAKDADEAYLMVSGIKIKIK
ncbi:MAG: adenosylcobinamide kinase/adenosylcobinamide phosphate guanyltransferase [Flavobacteriia bacterium]|nr:MAG: adenosylcobinamide kinase/adenosylcobinamide phosphate guanyltransferase [Flavobacteriia bacterium]